MTSSRFGTLALVLAACGPTPPPSIDAGLADAADASPSGCAVADARARVFLSTADDEYMSGSLCSVVEGTFCATPDLVPLSGDSVLGWHGSTLVALNYSGAGQDNATYINVATAPPTVQCQVAVQASGEMGSADPRGYVAVDARRGYVTRYSQPSLGIVDSVACSMIGTIDLSSLDGQAPLPYAHAIAMVGGNAWVALERLAPSVTSPTQPGAIAVVDPTTDQLVDADPTMPGTQGIALHHPNPVGMFVQVPGRVWIACVGAYQTVGDGAVEEIDPVAMQWTRDVVTESEVGGNIDSAAALDSNRVVLRVTSQAVGTAISQTSLVEWDGVSQTMQTWLTLAGYPLTDPIVTRDGNVYVGDRGDPTTGRVAGIRVFSPTGSEITPAPVACDLPPYNLSEVP